MRNPVQRAVESVKVPEFGMDFCYLLLDPKRRHQLGGQAMGHNLCDGGRGSPESTVRSNINEVR